MADEKIMMPERGWKVVNFKDMPEEFKDLWERSVEETKQRMNALAKADMENGSALKQTLNQKIEKFLKEFCFPEKREDADKALTEMLLDVSDDASIFYAEDDEYEI